MDMGFSGNQFTWTNAREDMALIQERLDRTLFNASWLETLPQTQVTHLPRSYSNHCPPSYFPF